MTDILERYRAMIETSSVFAVDTSALLRDMAAEIERLRSAPVAKPIVAEKRDNGTKP